MSIPKKCEKNLADNMDNVVDITLLRKWIGRNDASVDKITPELIRRFDSIFNGREMAEGDTPAGIQWCLAPAVAFQDSLGPDGHPARGGFLPPVPLQRRMWASGKLSIHQAFPIDVDIEKTSTIADIVLKEGSRSGPLVFVDVVHQHKHAGLLLFEEVQTIVYRQWTPFSRRHPQPDIDLQNTKQIVPDTTMLFRYSALTFNGHRIHYDHDYARQEEGYPSLVVHGPLIATFLMKMAIKMNPESKLTEFEFRGVAPAFVGEPLFLMAVSDTNSLEARNGEGALIMQAEATFGRKSHA